MKMISMFVVREHKTKLGLTISMLWIGPKGIIAALNDDSLTSSDIPPTYSALLEWRTGSVEDAMMHYPSCCCSCSGGGLIMFYQNVCSVIIHYFVFCFGRKRRGRDEEA